MDLSTLIGIGAGVLMIAWAILKNGSLLDFVDLASVAITVGGTVATTMVHYPLPRLKAAAVSAVKVFRHRSAGSTETLVNTLVGYAERARREGLLALEHEAESAPDPFVRKGLQLVVDGTDHRSVRAILETDLSALEARHKQSVQIFETMAQLAPAFGLVGTLIGLVQMLKTLDDPSQIGPGMAVALLTTLYGALLANLVFTPMAGKLKARSAEEVHAKEIALEGLLAIEAGDSPQVLVEKLNAYLPPTARSTRAIASPLDTLGMPVGGGQGHA